MCNFKITYKGLGVASPSSGGGSVAEVLGILSAQEASIKFNQDDGHEPVNISHIMTRDFGGIVNDGKL